MSLIYTNIHSDYIIISKHKISIITCMHAYLYVISLYKFITTVWTYIVIYWYVLTVKNKIYMYAKLELDKMLLLISLPIPIWFILCTINNFSLPFGVLIKFPFREETSLNTPQQ